MIRRAAVAGRFYEGEAAALQRQIEDCLSATPAKQHAVGIVVPHAGYVYSGHVAGAVYSAVALPRRFVLLCPNHTGRGAPFAIQTAGQWETPLGRANIDEELGRSILSSSVFFSEDWHAHEYEHSLEVQLPFLQYLCPNFTFVPICIGDHRLKSLLEVAAGIANCLKCLSDPVLLIASSDMTHFESDASARNKDHLAIEQMLRVNAEGLHRVVCSKDISMCGFAPVTIVLSAASNLGAKQGVLVKYATSGEISGDFRQVVGYAGLLLN